MAQTSDGGYIVTGAILLIFGEYALKRDFWIAKLFPNGDVEWQKSYGIGDVPDPYIENAAYSVQQTSDGGYIVTGKTESLSNDFWVLKLSSDGSVEWQKSYGGSNNDRAYSVQQTSDDGYIVAGYTESFGAGSTDFWVLKLSSDGSVEWQKTYGGSNNDRAVSVQQTSDGGYIVVGLSKIQGQWEADIWILKLFPNGDVDWQRTYEHSYIMEHHLIQQTSDGGYIFAADTISFGAGGQDILVMKLLPDGDIYPSCGLIEELDVIVTETNILPLDTNALPITISIPLPSENYLLFRERPGPKAQPD